VLVVDVGTSVVVVVATTVLGTQSGQVVVVEPATLVEVVGEVELVLVPG
jgi:hypothetical protein